MKQEGISRSQRQRRALINLGLVLVLLATATASALIVPPQVARAADIFVNTTDDSIDAGTCGSFSVAQLPGPDGDISLREAICAANVNPGRDIIKFNIPGAGPHFIFPSGTLLPAITQDVDIDGLTQPGASCASWPPTLRIGISGQNKTGSILRITNGSSLIRGLMFIDATNLDTPSSGAALLIDGNGADDNVVQCNYFGTNETGNSTNDPNFLGLHIRNGADNNIIEGNLISNNTQGSRGYGFWIQDGATGTQIRGNYIGTNAEGTAALPNNLGMRIMGNSHDTIIENNVISGHSGSDSYGIRVQQSNNVEIRGNSIGTNAAGDAVIPNHIGIELEQANDAIVEDNIISGNTAINGTGLLIDRGSGHTVVGNLIGVAADGTSPLANNEGISIELADDTVVGSETDPTDGNIIANNAAVGVVVVGDFTLGKGNRILGNSIYDNGEIGIDLTDTGAYNGNGVSDTGPNLSYGNDMQPFPTLTNVEAGGLIQGTVPIPAGGSYRLEFFENTNCAVGSNTDRDGQTLVYATNENISVNPYTINFTNADTGTTFNPANTMSATITNLDTGNTSEFSACVDITGASADLELTKSADNITPGISDEVQFTLTVENKGPNDATGVEVTDLLPAGLSFNSATPGAGTYDEGTGLWDIGTIANGDTVDLTISTTVDDTGTIVNEAEITASDVLDPDSTPGNNVPTEDDQDSETLDVQAVDLEVTKAISQGPDAFADDFRVTFTVSVTNNSAIDATSVVVSDPVPSGMTYLEPFTDPPPYNEGTGELAVGDVLAGTTVSYDLPFEFSDTSLLTNTATLDSSDPADFTPDNNTASVNININDAPVVANDSYTVAAGSTLNVAAPGVLANDSDDDGDTITAILTSDVSNGTLTLNADGSFTYIPDVGFTGNDQFRYEATDGSSTSPTDALVTITVTGIGDQPPDATDDTYSTNEDEALTIAAPGVLDNDTDPNGDDLSAVAITNGTTTNGGTVTLNSDGSFTYTPPPDYNNNFTTPTPPDTFQYTVEDETGLQDNGTVTINVTPVNDDPIFTLGPDQTFTSVPAGLQTVPGWATDIAVGPSTAADELATQSLTGFTVTIIDGGGITFDTDPALALNGQLTYEIAAGSRGAATIGVTLSDDAGATSAQQTFQIIVNEPPVADDDSYTTDEDTPLTVDAPGVLDGDTDADSDPLTAVLVTDVATGTLNLNTDGSFTYTPPQNFNGQVTFTYVANDGSQDSNEATVTINVMPVNDAPVNSVPGDQTTLVNTPLSFSAANGNQVQTSDVDVDPDVQDLQVTLTITNGTLTLSNTVGLSFSAGDGLDDDFMVFSGTLTTINQALGGMLFTPATGFEGLAQIQLTTSDLGNVGTGDVLSDTNIINIEVTEVPAGDLIAVDDVYTTTLNTPLVVDAPGILINDISINPDDILTATVRTGLGVQNGTLTLNPDGSFTYTPNPGFTGIDGFVYEVTDEAGNTDRGQVTINVQGQLRANDDEYATAVNTELTIPAPGVLSNDTRINQNDTFTPTLVSDVTNGVLVLNDDGSFTYTPENDFVGTDTFTYRLTDNNGNVSDPATVTIQVGDTPNTPPVAVDDEYTTPLNTVLTIDAPGVIANDTDADGDVLTATLVTDVANGTLVFNEDGSFTYTPDADFSGTDTFTYRVNDGVADSPDATVTIRVGENTPPQAVDDAYTTPSDTPLVIAAPGILGNDSDAENDPLTAILVDDVTNGTLVLNVDGSFVYTPTAGFVGTDTFTYRVSDGSAESDTATVTIRVGAAVAPGIYLPLIMRPEVVPPPIEPTPTPTATSGPPPVEPTPTPTMQPVAQPDLVGAVTLSPNKQSFAAGESVVITVQVTNQGNAPTSSRFWVDLFINPLVPPSATGDGILWQNDCALQPCFGLTWAVNQTLQPGESVVLSSVPGSYASDYTRWPGWFASGTNSLYLYVDSWNPGFPYRAVPESNEINNIVPLTGLSVTGTNPPLTNLMSEEIPERPAIPPAPGE